MKPFDPSPKAADDLVGMALYFKGRLDEARDSDPGMAVFYEDLLNAALDDYERVRVALLAADGGVS